MGEHQCPHCGHITTGFEDQDFKLMREAEEAKDAEIAKQQRLLDGRDQFIVNQGLWKKFCDSLPR